MLELILGGARSGKSHYAEQRAEILVAEHAYQVIYLATANASDPEMAARIARHQADRSPNWVTVETPVKLGDTVRQYGSKDHIILIDCLTLWLSNIMFDSNGRITERCLQRERDALLGSLATAICPVIMVSNELGLGVIPNDPGSRRFVDEAGWLHQELARICQSVVFMTAGIPRILK